MAVSDRDTARPRKGLAVGHVLAAPATALWTGILIGSVVSVVTSLLGGDRGSLLKSATPNAGYYVGAILALPMLLPLLGSLQAAYGFCKGRHWARPLGAALSLSCMAGIVNGFFWAVLYARERDYLIERAVAPAFVALAALALPWCAYVLVQTRPSRAFARARSSHPPRRRPLLGVAVLALALAAASQIPMYFRGERRDQLQVLWSKDRAYVCAGRRTSAGGKTLGGVLGVAVGYSPLRLSGLRQRSDLVVVEIGPEGFHRTVLEGFPSRSAPTTARNYWGGYGGGSCYINDGVLHYQETSSGALVDWRWRAGTFERLSPEDTFRIRAATRHGSVSELVRQAGWQQDSFNSELEHRLRLDLGGISAVIRVEGDKNDTGGQRFTGTERVLLQFDGRSEVPLLTVQKDATRISRSDYRAFTAVR